MNYKVGNERRRKKAWLESNPRPSKLKLPRCALLHCSTAILPQLLLTVVVHIFFWQFFGFFSFKLFVDLILAKVKIEYNHSSFVIKCMRHLLLNFECSVEGLHLDCGMYNVVTRIRENLFTVAFITFPMKDKAFSEEGSLSRLHDLTAKCV